MKVQTATNDRSTFPLVAEEPDNTGGVDGEPDVEGKPGLEGGSDKAIRFGK
ncbi:hypothetical protein N9B17_05195 [Rhodopirellula sp.]|nr:hypothetical protein [Rhodopirellula sp.]